MKRTHLGKYLYTALGIFFTAMMLFPVYWMVNASLQSGASAANTSLVPDHPTVAAYSRAFSEQLGNLGTSLLIGLGTVALTLVIAAPAAYSLAMFRVRGSRLITVALLIAQMIPGVVIANSLYPAYASLGLLNNIPGLVLADATTSVPFAVLILRTFMEAIPLALIEAARIDGASHFRAFISVVLPISRNAVITAGLFSFLFAWSDFIFALTLTTTNSVRPITLGIYSYLSAAVQNWGPVLATSVIASVPAIILLVLAQRRIAAGAFGGAVK
ncbi:binding-protein-dependent transport systems inner membrane component [Catenulispora acidiphila DSM 44928]|uniref:Binding-protein-dependent transport systems inner membrane component n=1 Tax=Catenulispora acidiphila (strain DSM 44928 / JCM 14897 / NBRC 102108 / NRRL B-24433 / ID139908) TaxID=479433 RepID=C7Q3H4_CATAD|nr:carbohydrate ABC transporter permease [Catenulispora acidiphila]ACU75739.1 binding-protein-dependent transport systems inner membrane component [Catenulispora acidiphila DSM 44928]